MKIVSLASLAAASAFAAGPIDLNAPGALDQMKIDHPERYEAVIRTLALAEELPCKSNDLMRQLKARFDLRELHCFAKILTSYPPKRRVTFDIQGDKYAATVTLRGVEGRLVHAVDGGEGRPK